MDEDMLDTKINIENKKTESMSIAFNTDTPQLYICDEICMNLISA